MPVPCVQFVAAVGHAVQLVFVWPFALAIYVDPVHCAQLALSPLPVKMLPCLAVNVDAAVPYALALDAVLVNAPLWQ